MNAVSLKYFTACVIVVLLTCFWGCEQKSPALATVGHRSISSHEFEMIYRFNPYLAKVKNDSTAKRIILNALIAEKILATEAENLDLNNLARVKRQIRQMHKEAVVERLWQEKVYGDLTVSSAELNEALQKARQKQTFEYVIFDTELGARKAWENLNKSFTFRQIADLNGYAENEIPVDSITFGTSTEALENAVFALKINEISNPVKFGTHYLLVKKKSVRRQLKIGDQQQLQKKLSKIILDRKAQRSLLAYMKKNMKNFRYTLDQKRFKDLVKRLQELIFIKNKNSGKEEKNLQQFPEGLPVEILNSKIISFSDGSDWSVKNLLQHLEVGPYPVERSSKAAFQKSMIAATRMNLDNERFYRYGVQLGIDDNPEVKNETGMWADYILAEQMKSVLKHKEIPIDEFIAPKYQSANIKIDGNTLRDLPAERSDMMVMKTHFPLRAIAPVLHPALTK